MEIFEAPPSGAGVYARASVEAVWCTGHGGAFIRVIVGHNSPAMFSARGTGPEPALTT